jgi:predicted small lipoprotein YifL
MKIQLMALLCLLLSLSACGQKGPLILPEDAEKPSNSQQH